MSFDIIQLAPLAIVLPVLGAALSLVLMALVFICIGVMDRFSDGEEVTTV